MNNNNISNPKQEVSSGIMMNDKDYIIDILSSLKCMVKDYAVVLTEASNEVLHGKYLDMFSNFDNLQRNAYELMFRKGWYVLEKAENNKITQKYDLLNQELTDLSNN